MVSSIASVAKGASIQKGRVFGPDIDGIDRVIRIRDNPDCFGEYDYDEVAGYINDLSVSEFEESWVIRQLLDACDNQKHLFESRSK